MIITLRHTPILLVNIVVNSSAIVGDILVRITIGKLCPKDVADGVVDDRTGFWLVERMIHGGKQLLDLFQQFY